MRNHFLRAAANAAAGGPTYDADAQAMFNARAAVGDDPSAAYKQAISDYVIDLKAISGFWDNIIQLVVLAGATTVAGARLAIKGNNLTNNNFVNADIALKTGSIGDGTSKFWNTGYTGNPAGTGQNNFHVYGYYSERSTASSARALYGSGGTAAGRRLIVHDQVADNTAWRLNSNASFNVAGRAAGGHGIARGSSSSFQSLIAGTGTTHTDTSVAASNGPHYVLARGPDTGTTADLHANARLLVWALGTNVDLTNYNTPTADLVTALNAI